MEYIYSIFRPDSIEDTAASFSTTEPLPHMSVGNSLVLSIGDSRQKSGYHWEIKHVEIYFSGETLPENPDNLTGALLPRIRVLVYTRERDRIRLLQTQDV